MAANFISQQSGASHPLQPGGIYLGTVAGINGRKLRISVEHIGITVETSFVAARSPKEPFRKGDRVVCAFLNLEKNDLVVLGHVNRNWDVFTLQTFSNILQSRITALEEEVESLSSRLTNAETAITALQTGKANVVHTH